MAEPADANLATLLRERSAHAVDGPFLSLPDGTTHTYRSIGARAGELAGALTTLGATVGDRVVVQVDKSPDAVALYLACLRAGLVYVPLNPAYTPDEVAYSLGDADPSVFVTRPDAPTVATAGAIATLGTTGDGTLADAVAAADPIADIVRRSPDDPAAMLYTSGTTGRSKAAVLTHHNLAVNGFALHDTWGFGPDDVLLHTLPIFHVHGLFVALHCAMLSGCEVIFCPRFDIATTLRLLPRASVMMGVPTQYRRLLADPAFGADDCEAVRLFTCGSAPLPVAVFEEFATRTGHRIVERYGMTEVGILTSNPVEGEQVAGTVGYPLPGVELRVVDDGGHTVEADASGGVEVSGANVFAGYWGQPDTTAEAFTADGFFRTGDVGSLSRGGCLTLEGRKNDLIISGGLNIYPTEVERCLEGCASIAEVAVVGLPHDDLGEAVVVFAVPAKAAGVDRAEIDAACEPLARFKHPKQTVEIDALPRNAMGKVQKADLRQRHADLLIGGPPS